LKIIDAVTCGIISTHELRSEQYHDDETIQYATYGIVYMVTEMCKEFGVSRQDVLTNMTAMGYDREYAVYMLDRYEKWACHIVVKDTTTSTEHC